MLCIANLVGSSIKTVRQEVQLSDGADMGRHLNHSDQLIALQRPQVKQVGATASSEEPSIPADPSQARFICHRDKTTLEKMLLVMRDALSGGKGFVGDFGSGFRHRKLMFADEIVGLPSEDGVITETTQHDVTGRQEKHLQQEHSDYNSIKPLGEAFQRWSFNIYLLNANRLPGCELPYPKKGVQVPEVRCVQGSADGIVT